MIQYVFGIRSKRQTIKELETNVPLTRAYEEKLHEELNIVAKRMGKKRFHLRSLKRKNGKKSKKVLRTLKVVAT